MSSLPDLLGVSVPEALEQAMDYHREGRLQQAEALYQKILSIEPQHPDALHLLGLISHQSGQHQVAVDLISQAIASYPSAQMFCNLGVALQAMGEIEQAIESFKQAIAVQPQYAEAYFNMGASYQTQGDWTQAGNSYRQAISINENYAAALVNLGVVLFEQGEFEESIDNYRKALDIDPSNIDAHNNMGNALMTLCRLDEAAESHRRALILNPDNAEALLNMALVFQVQGKLDQAIEHYRQVLKVKPDYVSAHSNLIFAMDMHPGIDVATLQQERKAWGRHHADALLQDIPYLNTRVADRKLRVGYISPDFRKHSAMYVLGSMLMAFDREQFEVYAYSNSNKQDTYTQRLQQNVTCWRNVVALSDEALAAQIRHDQIDILVDPSSHMAGNRLLVFARKPAPIQITAWGYIGGTGMKAMDVFFADPIVVPPEERHLYAEDVVYLPNVANYFTFEPFPPVNALPALSGQGVTFGSFNRLAKVTPETFQLWAQVLLAIPNSRMILKTPELDQSSEKERVLNRFIASGIAPDRITLLGMSSWVDHMAAFNQVDISLDPFPHGGGVTALEGLMMGVPIVSLRWPTITGRLSAAILTPLGLTDWIADTPEQYVDVAVKKASDLMALAVLRKQLRKTMTDSLVGNPKAYAQAVEQQYRLLWKQWCKP